MKKIFLLVSIATLLFACTKEKEVQTPQHILIETIQAPNLGYEVQFLADLATFEVGYQKVYFQILKNDEKIKVDQAHCYPWMDMGMMQHGAPSEDLVWKKGEYEGAVVFSMASMNGSWELVFVMSNNNITDTLRFSVSVNANASGVKKLVSVTGENSKKYMIALVEPQKPQIGVNNLSLAVFENSNGVYNLAQGLTITINPQMTSMGHGSPNNINPIWILSTKHYDGRLNFTMSGDWRLFFDLNENGTTVVSQAFLDFNF